MGNEKTEVDPQKEISQIMQEIEELQEGMTQSAQPVPSKLTAVPPQTPHPEPIGPTPTSQEGALTMTLTGNMTLKLKYEYEGQEVLIGFEDHQLKIQLRDGTEFKIPVQRTRLRSVA